MNTLTKLLLTLMSIFFPFIMVWVVYLITGYATPDPKITFTEKAFWFLTVLYWVVALWTPLYAIWGKKPFQ